MFDRDKQIALINGSAERSRKNQEKREQDQRYNAIMEQFDNRKGGSNPSRGVL